MLLGEDRGKALRGAGLETVVSGFDLDREPNTKKQAERGRERTLHRSSSAATSSSARRMPARSTMMGSSPALMSAAGQVLENALKNAH